MMDTRHMRDSAFVESTEDDGAEETNQADTSLDLLEQQQAREQARLLQRFRELRHWQQQQQEQLMQQQQMQLEMLRGEQLRVQTLVASQRGAHWGDGRVSKPEGFRKSSPPLMTPPRRAVQGSGIGAELAKTMMAILPYASADSGLVASMGDTLDQPKDSLPRPIMYPSSPTADDDKYTNPELFSNPGSNGDDLQAVDDRFLDNRSDVSSDNFILPPLPPDRRDSRFGSMDGSNLNSLTTLQALMSSTAPNFLQQILGLLPNQQKTLLLEQRQAAIEESASPTFSPVTMYTARRSVASTSDTAFTSQTRSAASQSQGTFARNSPPISSFSQSQGAHRSGREVKSQERGLSSHSQSQLQQDPEQLASSYHQRQSQMSQSPLRHQSARQNTDPLLHAATGTVYSTGGFMQRGANQTVKPSQQNHHHLFQQTDAQLLSSLLSKQAHGRLSQQRLPLQPPVVVRKSVGDGEREGLRERDRVMSGQDREMEDGEEEDEEEEELEVTVKECGSPDDRPISGVGAKKTFEQLLEEQLADELQQKEEEEAAEAEKLTGPSKRPFLRKGQGIARFFQPIKQPPPKRSSGGGQKSDPFRASISSRMSHEAASSSDGGRASVHSKPLASKQPERKRASTGKELRKMIDDPPPQEKLKLIKRKSGSGRKMPLETVQTSETARPCVAAAKHPLSFRRVDQNGTGSLPHAKSVDGDEKDTIADDTSFVAGLKEREKSEPMEAEELEEFELLEDIADNMSLVSNSSVVARLITPNKQRQKAAVSDLKIVMEKKKNAVSSPFERNAAMRSLLSVNIPCSTTQAQPGIDADEHDDTLTEDTRENGVDLEDVSVTESDDDDMQTNPFVHAATGKRAIEADKDTEDDAWTKSSDTISGGLFSQKGQQLNGFDFSSKFTLFDQHRHCGEDGSRVMECPPSPTKSVTRKVATIQSRLSAANDTASLLQKLSARAGFLSSGFSQVSKEGSSVLLQTMKKKCSGVTKPTESDESQDDSSLSSAMPQPFVIGGVGKYEDTVVKHSGVETVNTKFVAAEMDNAVRTIKTRGDNAKVSVKNKTDHEEEEMVDEEMSDDDNTEEGENDSEKVDAKHDLENESDSGGEGVRWTSDEVVTNDHQGSANSNNNEGFDDEEEWTSGAPQVVPSEPSKPSGDDLASTPPTSKLMSRLFPSLKPKPTAAQQQQQQKLQMASSTNIGDGVQSKILREKLAELETEIEKFRCENATLERLRKDREEGLSKLKEEIARFEQEKSAELKRLEEFKAQETKKLKQERKLFETYQKQVRAMPDKKDREEIEMLKNQLSDLQDEMKRKESRWSSNVTRLKSRITELEGENVELRDEMKLLERKRLEWIQTAKPASAGKSMPQRSSTPTNIISNGYHEGSASFVNGNNFNLPQKPAAGSADNGAGATGKATSGSGGHNGSGGESMPRGLGITPSMIEGVSIMSIGDGGDGGGVETKTPHNPPAVDRPTVDKGNRKYEETQYSDGKVERVYSNGAREVLFANGTRKEIASDGQYIIVSFFNGDIKQIFPDQHVVYYYAEAQTTHTTYPDKLEVLQFSNGQTEKHYPDGTKEITFPDQTVKYLFPNGTEESIFQDGTIMRIDKSGERILEFPNGQREVHTQQYKRREYPDGTVKTLHNDGRQETRYSTGRIRLKDKDGNILLDRMY